MITLIIITVSVCQLEVRYTKFDFFLHYAMPQKWCKIIVIYH